MLSSYLAELSDNNTHAVVTSLVINFRIHIVARITVEDCLTQIDNRFELSLAAATRARQLVAGHQPLVEDGKRDKPVVVALREIASGKIDRTILKRLGL